MIQHLLSSVIMISFLVQMIVIGLAAITGSVGLEDGTFSYSRDSWVLHDLSSPIFLRYFDIPLTWVEAEEVCRRNFGHLVRDGSGNEEFVHDFISELDVTSEVWIGLYQGTPSDRFHWA